MDGDAIKKLRSELGCSARDLARTLGLEQKDVLAWERNETFPTKRHVDVMEALRSGKTKLVVERTARTRGATGPTSPFVHLDDPEFWSIVRKLLAHPTLLASVRELARGYDEPPKG